MEEQVDKAKMLTVVEAVRGASASESLRHQMHLQSPRVGVRGGPETGEAQVTAPGSGRTCVASSHASRRTPASAQLTLAHLHKASVVFRLSIASFTGTPAMLPWLPLMRSWKVSDLEADTGRAGGVQRHVPVTTAAFQTRDSALHCLPSTQEWTSRKLPCERRGQTK